MTENPLRGIALIVAATICFSLSDTLAKYLTSGLPAVEIAWVRYVVFTLLAACPLIFSGRSGIRVRSPGLQVARGLGVVGSAVLFILALAHLPMAEAATVSFASPLLITVLAIPLLGEVVGFRGWMAVLAGFAGVLIVVRPGTGGFHPAALLVVLSSLCWSLAMILTRKMAGTERPAATLLWTAVTGLVVLSLLLPFSHAPLGPRQLGLAIVLGLVAATAQWLAVLAYRHAAASVLAPLSYGQLIWSSSFGYVVFGSIPDGWTVLGAVIIVGSGLYTVRREWARLHPRPRLASAA
ncbi:MAG TPA: DMT family transporter [Acetobacteraceae bacterium]|nr:DMT family transporter [Acetobacteraceae bacterium]